MFNFTQAYMNSRHIGWFIVTTGMITALPLIFEVSSLLKHRNPLELLRNSRMQLDRFCDTKMFKAVIFKDFKLVSYKVLVL